MAINGIGGISAIDGYDAMKALTRIGELKESTVVKNADRARINGFDDIFKGYLGLIEETNAYETASDQAQIDFVTGKTDDMAAVLLAQEKAYASLNFTVQITNKILDAYHEIMRMQM